MTASGSAPSTGTSAATSPRASGSCRATSGSGSTTAMPCWSAAARRSASTTRTSPPTTRATRSTMPRPSGSSRSSDCRSAWRPPGTARSASTTARPGPGPTPCSSTSRRPSPIRRRSRRRSAEGSAGPRLPVDDDLVRTGDRQLDGLAEAFEIEREDGTVAALVPDRLEADAVDEAILTDPPLGVEQAPLRLPRGRCEDRRELGRRVLVGPGNVGPACDMGGGHAADILSADHLYRRRVYAEQQVHVEPGVERADELLRAVDTPGVVGRQV